MNQLQRVSTQVECNLCTGSGKNFSGLVMKVNNHICPRCGGYGKVPGGGTNEDTLTNEDRGYARSNGLMAVLC